MSGIWFIDHCLLTPSLVAFCKIKLKQSCLYRYWREESSTHIETSQVGFSIHGQKDAFAFLNSVSHNKNKDFFRTKTEKTGLNSTTVIPTIYRKKWTIFILFISFEFYSLSHVFLWNPDVCVWWLVLKSRMHPHVWQLLVHQDLLMPKRYREE